MSLYFSFISFLIQITILSYTSPSYVPQTVQKSVTIWRPIQSTAVATPCATYGVQNESQLMNEENLAQIT